MEGLLLSMPLSHSVFKSAWGITRIELSDSSKTSKGNGSIAPMEPTNGGDIIPVDLEVWESLSPEDPESYRCLGLRCYEELATPLTRISDVRPTAARCASERREIQVFSGHLFKQTGGQSFAREHVGLWGISELGEDPITEVAWFTGTQPMPAALEARKSGWKVVPINFAKNDSQTALLVYKTSKCE